MKGKVPPEVLSGGEIFGSLEVDSSNDIVVEFGALDSPPKMELLMLILMAEFDDSRLKSDDLLGGEGLTDSIYEFEF